jgi:hypothetical protein
VRIREVFLICLLLAPGFNQSANQALASAPAPQADSEHSEYSYGVQMLQAARSHEGAEYKKGMQCSDLIIAASKAIGLIQIPQVLSKGDKTITETWFLHGMGPEYRLVVEKVPLSKLIEDEVRDPTTIPLGAVIVTSGHAALFNGFVRVNNTWQLSVYDAIDREGWYLALSGTASKTDPPDRMLAFRGYQVGEHVTRLNWNPNPPKGVPVIVSVYEEIGKQSAALKLTPASPAGVGDATIVAPGKGLQRYTLYSIDTRSFAAGGVLDVDIQIASNSATDGSFDLFPANTHVPTEGKPVSALTSRHDMRKGTSTRLQYRFSTGQLFVLGLDGNWFSPKGATGTVHFRASVER